LGVADTNGADRVIKEVVGFDSWRDLAEPLREGRKERDREAEAKLILSADRSGWNLAGNLIAEKNLAGPPWEFGYAIAASRPLALAATPASCWMCRENITLGVELYGGLGDQRRITLAGTSRYIAPALAWSLPGGMIIRVSPAW